MYLVMHEKEKNGDSCLPRVEVEGFFFFEEARCMHLSLSSTCLLRRMFSLLLTDRNIQ